MGEFEGSDTFFLSFSRSSVRSIVSVDNGSLPFYFVFRYRVEIPACGGKLGTFSVIKVTSCLFRGQLSYVHFSSLRLIASELGIDFRSSR